MSKIANRKGQVFLPSYMERNNYIVKSTKGAVYAHCNLCNCDFTVSHGGWNSVTDHMKTAKHQKITPVILNSRCIDIEVPRDIVSSNFLNDL